MSAVNRIVLVGRVASDITSRYTQTGKQVVSFRLAVDRGKVKGESVADFIPITTWDKLAGICAQYLTKGKLIAVTGRLQTRTYEQDGRKCYAFDVVADNMSMLSTGRSDNNGAPSNQGYNRPGEDNSQNQFTPSPEAAGFYDESSYGADDISAEVPF